MTEIDIPSVRDYREIDICAAMFEQVGETVSDAWRRTKAEDLEFKFGVVEKDGNLTATNIHKGEEGRISAEVSENVWDEMASLADEMEESDAMRFHAVHTHPEDAGYSFSFQDFVALVAQLDRPVTIDSSLVLTNIGDKMSIYGYEVEGRFISAHEQRKMRIQLQELQDMVMDNKIPVMEARNRAEKIVLESYEQCHMVA